MTTLAATLSAVGAGGAIRIRSGDQLSYTADLSGDFDGVLTLERSTDNLRWEQVVAIAADVSDVRITNELPNGALYRFRVRLGVELTLTGSVVTSLDTVGSILTMPKDGKSTWMSRDSVKILEIKDTGVETLKRIAQKRILNAALSKAGATAGWVMAATDNVALATCPAAKTGSTLVIPVTGLKVGDVITAFHGIGQIEAAGNTATLDIALRKHTAAAADVADASVAAITQLSAIADTIISSANAGKTGVEQVVAADESYYFLVTATTGAAVDIALQAIAIVVTEN